MIGKVFNKRNIIYLSLVLCFSFMFYISLGNIIYKGYDDGINLDKRFEEVSKELEDYGGAMIVKYDPETGEIIGKRPAYKKEAGVFTVRTQEEADLILGKVPDGVEVIIVEEDVSPSRAVEVGGSY